jgi:hypothetical protein
MGLFDWFRRPSPIRNTQELAEFVDQRAAFLAQKGIYEYARARAAHYAKVLFKERAFQDAVEQSRWQAFPMGLAMVAEVAEGILLPHVGDKRRVALDVLRELVLAIYDRYPVSPQLGEAAWQQNRDELARHLDQIGLHPPKYAKDIPEPYAERYFAIMPIHEKLRGRDFFTTRNYLRVTIINIHDELAGRLDARAVAAMLCEQAPPPL